MKNLKESISLLEFLETNPCFVIISDIIKCSICSCVLSYNTHSGFSTLKQHLKTYTPEACGNWEKKGFRRDFVEKRGSSLKQNC
jgi:hypothetical protein